MSTAVTNRSPPIAENAEAARLAAVRRYDILDTPPDGSFDHVAEIAAKLFDVPIAIISLVDQDRIWFKAHHGLDVEEIGREPGLCASAILQTEPYVLTDASCDPRSLANPLVAGEFGLRFYVAAPLRTSDGHNLGTLCVIDQEPRTVTERQIAQLQSLAAIVIDQMELRLAARSAVSHLENVVTQREAALGRAEMLAKEIDHRVMNSLQQVSALLGLQGRQLGDTDAAHQLTLAASRVSAVARVHQHIYQNDERGAFGCLRYLERMCEDLSDLLGGGTRIAVEGSEAELPVEVIPPIGLAVNELVTNAAKNGAGTVTVSFGRAEDGGYVMTVADDGPGFPAGFDPETSAGLGMKVVRMIVRQLGGTLNFDRSDALGGASIAIRFPEPQANANPIPTRDAAPV